MGKRRKTKELPGVGEFLATLDMINARINGGLPTSGEEWHVIADGLRLLSKHADLRAAYYDALGDVRS